MSKLQQLIAQIDTQSLPPVHAWKPDFEGEIDISIDAQGNWFHEGQVITREKLVVLFASILWFEKGQYYLVTPVEKLAIEVVDVPYIIHQAEKLDDAWVITTNTHEQIVIGPEHFVELREFQGQQLPYVNIRYDLWGRVNRSIYYQWVTEALDSETSNTDAKTLVSSGENQLATIKENNAPITLTSQGYVFPVAQPEVDLNF